MNIKLGHKKVYFASDFHLGAPNWEQSRQREEKIINWLDEVSKDAAAIFLVGDIFDFWFEYDKVIPKGFIKFISKISSLRDSGIPIIFFTGNHDLWFKDYFTQELSIPINHNPLEITVEGKKLLIGHGDGLGPGDEFYKFLKSIFTNRFFQWIFKWLHPDIGIRIAQAWSGKSRLSNMEKQEDLFKGEEEWLWAYCKQIDKSRDFDYYIFGHRHLPLDLPVGKNSRYINLGEWVSQFTYAVLDKEGLHLKKFEG
ncbi:UDP-2,3-diacylglucosamine diphosphatase [Belliella kenyensis]|uniref:UDP-2,3-diacylglucosamine diphosphatase n=1 Tax=Belliella kenyensis TaxID=1472724 RepID=A0ABV8ENT2_9BACT|nr:UDP-2,3-diacylglucosamine diphosphatase [Belliella kenyensis]MCH7403662.1 UDP-2,3-diacylglucosamine diphosphatase [Belliella kenyensis]MDN3602184.1 UDP-2,3-diacylglucosamine diphosphatase [Belliella kenyensis]